MKNIVATIPKGRFKTWELAEAVCKNATVKHLEKTESRGSGPFGYLGPRKKI